MTMAMASNNAIDNKLECIVDILRNKAEQFDFYADVIKIAKTLDLNVFEATFENDSISGYLDIDLDNKDESGIYVNENHPSVRKRFTIAHEIGHYIFNHIANGQRQYRKIDYDISSNMGNEAVANSFASVLLMPQKLIENIWYRFQDIKIVAMTFGVSEECAMYRLKNLGLLQNK